VRRRDFVISMVAGAVLWPALSRAQSRKPAPRIGILAQFGVASRFSLEFREGMRELGYVEGRNLAIEFASAAGRPDRLPDLARELVKLKVDVIVASGSEATLAARNATTAIPIVMTSSNPLGIGIVASLARPGGNITGLSLLAPEVSGKRVEILKQILPGIARAAVLLYPDDPGVAFSLKETEAAARATGLKLQIVETRNAAAFDDAFEAAARERAEAVIVLPAPLMNVEAGRIAELALKYRLPTIYFSDEFAKAGGLVSYGVSLPASYRRLAYYVDRILKGAHPGDLPVEQPTKFDLVINMKTAKALGLTVPQSLLLRADEVIQ
jgi:putative ABC transport system substrate-binding protein